MKLISPFDPSLGSGILDTKGVNTDEQLMIYNDSLYGLQFTFADNSIDVIPPSWNKDIILKNIPMGKITWKVYNQIVASNYPVSQVYGTLYEPGEHVASVNAGMQRGFTLTGGNVNVSNTTLSNEGNPINTQVIDIGTVANPSLWLIDNDHFAIGIEISGVKHVIFIGSTTGSPLQIGQTSDTAEFKGNALVDGTTTTNGISNTGTISSTGNISSSGGTLTSNSDVTGNGTLHKFGTITDSADNSYLAVTASTTTRIASGTGGQVVTQVPGGSTQHTVNSTDVISQLQFTAPKYILGGSSGQYNGYTGSWSRISTGTYTSSTSAKTVNHGLGGAPTNVMITGGVSTGSSSSGADTYGATTFTVIDGFAGVTMRFRAERA